jgi:hypothetical protein
VLREAVQHGKEKSDRRAPMVPDLLRSGTLRAAHPSVPTRAEVAETATSGGGD